MKAANKSHSLKRLLSKTHNTDTYSYPKHNETKLKAYCQGCKCKVDIINIKKKKVKGQYGVLRQCITGECVSGHKWSRVLQENNTQTKHIRGQIHKMTEFKKGINIYATIKDFTDAHTNGIKRSHVIPRNNITFDRDGVNFDEALKDIKTGQKTRHWIWYILPSSLNTSSRTAKFFKINTYITPKQYIDNDLLFKNYISIINAIYDSLVLKTNKSLVVEINKEALANILNGDYDKLCNSVKMFKDVVISKLEILKHSKDSIDKINAISIICEHKEKIITHFGNS